MILGPDGNPLKTLDKDWKQETPSAATLVAYYRNTVYAAARLTADKICNTTLRLYRKKKSGLVTRKKNWSQKSIVSGRDPVQEVGEHRALDLLRSPNEFLYGSQLLEYIVLYLETAGWCYLNLRGERQDNGLVNPEEIYIFPPHMVEVKKDQNNEIEKYIWAGSEDVVPQDILTIKEPLLANPYGEQGDSPVSSVYDQLKLQEQVTAALVTIMNNEGRPSGILSPVGEWNMLDEDSAERWRTRYTRFIKSGSGGIFVNEQDARFTPLTWKPADLASIEIADHIDKQVAKAHRIPVMILTCDGINVRSALQAAFEQWCETGIGHRLRNIEEFLNYRYLPFFGEDDLFFCFDDPSPRMEELKAQVDTAYVNAGVLKPNEVRSELGYEPTADGEALRGPSVSSELAQQMTGDTPANAGESATPPDAPPVPTEQEIHTNPTLTLNGAQIQSAMDIVGQVSRGELPRETGIGSLIVLLNLTSEQAEQIMGPVGKTFFAATPEQAQQQAAKALKIAKARKPRTIPINQDLATLARKHFSKWEQAMLSSLGTAKKMAKAFRPMKQWSDALAKDAIPYVEITYRQGAEQVLSDVGASEDKLKVVNPLVRQYAEKATYNFAESTVKSVTGQVNEALDKLRADMGEGLEAGERLSQLAARVKEIFGGLSDSRAELIAQTESAAAYTRGHIEGAKASGVVRGFEWLTSDAPCPECEAMNGRKFDLNDEIPMPLHPGCLCVLLDTLDSAEEG